MKITLIWVQQADVENWLFDAWDEYSIEQNYEGFEEKMKAAKVHGEVRLMNISVPSAAVDDLYKVPDVKATIEPADS